MTMPKKPAPAWRRRHLLAGVAGLAFSAGLGACATDQPAVGATAAGRGREPSDEEPPSSPGLLAYRTGRNFANAAAPAGSTFSIFQSFAPGAVPPGNIVRVAAGGAPVVRQQCDNRVTWPDGALRSAVFTWTHPHSIAGGGRSQITLHAQPGSWDETPSVTLKDVLAHDYQLQVGIGGSTYVLRANDAIAAGRVARIRSGPAGAAWKVWGDLRGGPAPTSPAHGQMWAKMFIYIAHDGQVRIEDEIYCNKIADSTALQVSGYALLDGTRALSKQTKSFVLRTRNKFATYDANGTEYFSRPELGKVVWGFPRPVHGRRVTTGLYDGLITWWNEWTPAYIGAFPRPRGIPYAPADFLTQLFAGAVDGTGNHIWLGPMTSLAVMAMLSPTFERQRDDRIMALGSWSVCAYWCADDATGLPPVLTNKSYHGLSKPITQVGWGLAPTLRMTGGANPGTTSDASHAGLWWWWQYLSTGSEQALENVQEQAVGVLGCDVAQSGSYQRNPIFVKGGPQFFGSYAFFPQSRAVGWELRNLSNAHWVTPDSHPLKRYLNDLLQVQYDSAAAGMAANEAQWGALAMWITPQQDSPWMDDYRVTSILMDYRRGRIPRSHLAMRHVIKHCYGRMVDGNFPNGAGAYRLGFNVGPNPKAAAINQPSTTIAQSWTQVYGFQDPPGMTDPLIGTPPLTRGLRDYRTHGPDAAILPSSHTFVGHTYPNIALCAGSCGVMAGLGAYPEKVVAYLHPIIDRASEELWGSTSGAQAWRIRPPA